MLGASTTPRGDAPIVVFDRAAPVAAEEVRLLCAAGRRVVLLDDLGPARRIADVVIDPPTAAAWPPAAGMRLAGPEHVLLREAVRAAASQRTAASGQAAGSRLVSPVGVLLALGGSDPTGLTPSFADALSATGIDLAVALGPGYRGLSPTSGTLLRDPGAFVPALAHADLLVTGYGHTLLEAAHLGVPAVAVVYRPAQLEHARAFCRMGTARILDITTDPDSRQVAALVSRLLGEPRARAAMAARGRELIDGRGARRVMDALEALV
jgi:spore coat polysaccharide biosynthesis predicted glycosyltransferase SpsG